MPRLQLSSRALGSAGTVAIEYALVLPVLLLFTFGIMDASRLLWANITLSHAAEAAARCWAVNACAAGSVEAYAATQAWGIDNVTFSTSPPACVSGSYTFQFIVPWFPQFSSSAPFGGTTLTLTATACYPLQPTS